MPCARRDSRLPPFRTERGKMGHPLVWLGEIECAGVRGDARSLDCAPDDKSSAGPHERERTRLRLPSFARLDSRGRLSPGEYYGGGWFIVSPQFCWPLIATCARLLLLPHSGFMTVSFQGGCCYVPRSYGSCPVRCRFLFHGSLPNPARGFGRPS